MNRVFYAVIKSSLTRYIFKDKAFNSCHRMKHHSDCQILLVNRVLVDNLSWVLFILLKYKQEHVHFLLLSTAFLKAAVSNLVFLAINLLQHWLQHRLAKRKPLCQDKNTAIITPLQACNQTETAQTFTDRPSVHRSQNISPNDRLENWPHEGYGTWLRQRTSLSGLTVPEH